MFLFQIHVFNTRQFKALVSRLPEWSINLVFGRHLINFFKYEILAFENNIVGQTFTNKGKLFLNFINFNILNWSNLLKPWSNHCCKQYLSLSNRRNIIEISCQPYWKSSFQKKTRLKVLSNSFRQPQQWKSHYGMLYLNFLNQRFLVDGVSLFRLQNIYFRRLVVIYD